MDSVQCFGMVICNHGSLIELTKHLVGTIETMVRGVSRLEVDCACNSFECTMFELMKK